MPIIFHEKSKTFHLFNDSISYIMRVMENDQLEQLYYGKKLADKEEFKYLQLRFYKNFVPNAKNHPGDGMYSLTHLKQEYPTFGSSDLRQGAFTIAQENGSEISDFVYKSHEIYAGKRAITPLPATYVESDDEATSLAVTLYDEVSGTELVLNYTIYENLPVITRNAKFTQTGEQKIVLQKALSMCMDYDNKDFQLIHLDGAWTRERYVGVHDVHHGVQSIQSLKGNSSCEHNPFLALKKSTTTEFAGEAYGFSLVYSGNFLAQVEATPYDNMRVVMGIHPDTFAWNLAQGESFQTPECVMVYSNEGLNGMSQAYHKLYRNRLARGKYKLAPRPILLNSWEAVYMTFDENKLLEIAQKAADTGMELFVLDDGWFGTRDDDTQGLGDWFVNKDKIPSGIDGLSKKVNEMGIGFGIWIEPEMVNKNTKLYAEHPDWLMSTPNRYESPSRFQHVLDFSNDEVVEYVYSMLDELFSKSSIQYVKWDMNRYLSEVYSNVHGASQQKEIYHRYILGVYKLYTKLTTKFPEILFESCSGGGARFDPGMFFFAPQAWCSDDTDAVERLKIQYGSSMVYPLSFIVAHVSDVPNHQIFRSTPMYMRGTVAQFGSLGYEIDLNKISEEDLEAVKDQIAFCKEYRDLIHSGDFYRLISPFEGSKNFTSWQVVAQDKSESIVGYYQILNEIYASIYKYIKLQGLDRDKNYSVEVRYNDDIVPVETNFSGAELMDVGYPFSQTEFRGTRGDFQSFLLMVKEVK